MKAKLVKITATGNPDVPWNIEPVDHNDDRAIEAARLYASAEGSKRLFEASPELVLARCRAA